MKTVFGFLMATLLVLAGAAAPQSASADSITIRVQSDYPYIIHYQVHSYDRNWVWPAAGRVYVLDDYEVNSVRLSCQPNELVCLGAWDPGGGSGSWGVGENNDQQCSNCCYRCNGGTTDVIRFLQ